MLKKPVFTCHYSRRARTRLGRALAPSGAGLAQGPQQRVEVERRLAHGRGPLELERAHLGDGLLLQGRVGRPLLGGKDDVDDVLGDGRQLQELARGRRVGHGLGVAHDEAAQQRHGPGRVARLVIVERPRGLERPDEHVLEARVVGQGVDADELELAREVREGSVRRRARHGPAPRRHERAARAALLRRAALDRVGLVEDDAPPREALEGRRPAAAAREAGLGLLRVARVVRREDRVGRHDDVEVLELLRVRDAAAAVVAVDPGRRGLHLLRRLLDPLAHERHGADDERAARPRLAARRRGRPRVGPLLGVAVRGRRVREDERRGDHGLAHAHLLAEQAARGARRVAGRRRALARVQRGAVPSAIVERIRAGGALFKKRERQQGYGKIDGPSGGRARRQELTRECRTGNSSARR